MVKKYIDIDGLLRKAESKELNQQERHYRELMQEVPNFNHGEYFTDKRVYEKNEYIILEVKSKGRTGYIVQNTKKPFSEGHSHLKSFNMAKVLISNVMGEKKPKTSNIYLLESHIRISDNEKYIANIKHLIEVKKCKKDEYVNRTSDKRR